MQIQLEHVWKGYRLNPTTLNIMELAGDGQASQHSPSARERQFWALRDVMLDVQPGESLGIVGHNGAGKSTILRLIGGVTYPSKGVVRVRGRVGALIEVGAGMHPELTGRENVHLYGAILGLSRLETRRRFDEIVAFSEVEKFLDVPMKWYSSGMKVRLGFAITAFLHPDVFLIDEVLAVGDWIFQRKCVDHMRTLHRAGTTLIFVSHHLSTVERVCQRVLWVDQGRIAELGDGPDVISKYRAAVERHLLEIARRASNAAATMELEQALITDRYGIPRSEFRPGEDIVVNVHYQSRDAWPQVELVIKLATSAGTIILVARSGSLAELAGRPGKGMLRWTFPSLPLSPGTYRVWGRVASLPDRADEVPWHPLATFTMGRPSTQDHAWTDLLPWETSVLALPVRWTGDGAGVQAERAIRLQNVRFEVPAGGTEQ